MQPATEKTSYMEDCVRVWLNDDAINPIEVANSLTDELCKSLSYYPKPVGTGMTLLLHDGQVINSLYAFAVPILSLLVDR